MIYCLWFVTLKHGGSLIVKQAKSSSLNSNLTRLKQFPGLVQDNYIQKYQDKKNKQTNMCNRKFHHNGFWNKTHSLRLTSLILWVSLFLSLLLFILFLNYSRNGALPLVCSDSSFLKFIINPIQFWGCIVGIWFMNFS